MTTRRHDERYERAKARITPERVVKTEARVLRDLGLVDYPKDVSTILRVDKEVDIRLGLRAADRRHQAASMS